MAGSKRQKVKKLLSPSNSRSPPLAGTSQAVEPSPPEPSDDLVDDLLSQLDSQNQTVQAEAASVLRDVQATELDAANHQGQDKKAGSSRSRFQARQVHYRVIEGFVHVVNVFLGQKRQKRQRHWQKVMPLMTRRLTPAYNKKLETKRPP